MARKTRKHIKSTKGVYSIPELRRAFEHIEQVMDDMIRSNESKHNMILRIRKEWTNVFHKTLDKESADAMISHRMESMRNRRTQGGAMPIQGAPLDYVTRPGLYLDQGRVPGPDGGLTQTVGGGGYGSYVEYVDRGFVHPEIAKHYDPVPNQAMFPMAPRMDMGSNVFTPLKGGKRRKTRKTRGGMAIIQQAFMRPIPADTPPTNPLFDAQRILNGAPGGMSPDQTQRLPSYHLNDVYPKAVNINV
jgi:hypothetical protein